jgi:hypothetical protein
MVHSQTIMQILVSLFFILSPQITEHKDHGMNLYDVENPGPVWNRHEYVAVLNRLMRSQPSGS